MPHKAPEQPTLNTMRMADFAQLIQSSMMPLIGRDDDLREFTLKSGKLTQTHTARLDSKQLVHSASDALPPNDPAGAPMSMTHSTIHRKVLQQRKEAGLRPTFKGGVSGAFGDTHGIFIGAGAQFGKLLNLDEIGNDPQHHARIRQLEAQWFDHKSVEERENVLLNRAVDPQNAIQKQVPYPDELKKELEALDDVPVQLKVNGRMQTFHVDNVHIGEKDACLAHILYAVGRNAISLSDRPEAEMEFIMSAVSNFSGILRTTDAIHDYLKDELKRQGVEDPQAVLEENNLTFPVKRAERLLQKHAPFLKLYDVISPLLERGDASEHLKPLLATIGESCEEHPPIVNAEHGARLLEALHYAVIEGFDRLNNRPTGTTAQQAEIDTDALRQELRKSADERPFDVAHLAELPQTKKLLNIARKIAADSGYTIHARVKRAVETFDRAVSQQIAVASKREMVADAVGHNLPEREGNPSTLVKVIDSGINHDELSHMMDEIHAQIFNGDTKGKSFSAILDEQLRDRAQRVRSENQPFLSF